VADSDQSNTGHISLSLGNFFITLDHVVVVQLFKATKNKVIAVLYQGAR
jgi:hypothetical protein